MTKSEPPIQATQLYAHWLMTVNWAVLTATFILGYFVFSTYLPYVLLVALVGITFGNAYVYSAKRFDENHD